MGCLYTFIGYSGTFSCSIRLLRLFLFLFLIDLLGIAPCLRAQLLEILEWAGIALQIGTQLFYDIEVL